MRDILVVKKRNCAVHLNPVRYGAIHIGKRAIGLDHGDKALPVNAAEKPKQLRNEARRQAIVDVASPAFLEKGYANISLSAIAAQVGGSKATMWRHFPSKADLFAAVLDRQTASFRESLEAVFRKGRTLRETLRDFCIAYMEKLNSEEAIALHRLVIAEAGRFPELGVIFYDRGPGLVGNMLAAFIRDASDRGEVTVTDADAAARDVIAMCLSDRFQKALFGIAAAGQGADFAEEADRIADQFMKTFA